MATFFRDLRYAARLLVRQPGFTTAAVVSLGLGLGANSALFNMFNSLLWRPLPVASPDAIVTRYTTREGQALYAGFSFPDYRDLRDQNDVFAAVAGHAPNRFALGILKFQAPLDDRTVDRIRARWKEIYGGYENWDEIGVLVQQGEYQRIGYTFDEMGFDALDERNETRILGPFGVPPILIGSRIGLSRSTYSNYDQAYDAFWNDTMLHEAKLFEDDYQYYLNDGNKFVAFDFSDVPAFQEDVPAIVPAWRGLVEYGIPKNMAADITGLQIGKLR